jgi:hypothetical protein
MEKRMKAIPMRGRLKGKRISGFLWAGPGDSWRRKENYFQLEDNRVVSAVLGSEAGTFWIRCKGATCEITLKGPENEVLGSAIVALPGGRKTRRSDK